MPDNLLLAYGAEELAQVAHSEDLAQIAPELMRLTIESGDRSSYTAEEIAAADEAMQRIQDALSRATAQMDGYLAAQYTLPLDAAVISGSAIPHHCGVIARYLLRVNDPEGNEETTPAAKRHKHSMMWLEDVAAGKVVLGGQLPTKPAGDMPVLSSAMKINWSLMP